MTDPNAGPSILVGIPAFNAEKTIYNVANNVSKYYDAVLVCDDGSTDSTAVAARRARCEVISHIRNKGYGAAIKTLLEAAREKNVDVLVTFDGDGQHNAAHIGNLVKPILEGEADIVIGSRFKTIEPSVRSIPFLRKMGINVITSLTQRLTKQNISDAQSGFRAYGRKAISLVNPGEQGMGASTEILLIAREHGLRILEVPISINYKTGSKTSTLNPLYHFADVVASTLKFVSIRHPLMVYGLAGVLLLVLSSVFGLWAIQLYEVEGRLITNLTLISIGLAVIGTILCITGMILFVLITVIREREL